MSRTITTLTQYSLASAQRAAPRVESTEWVPALVPGGVHESLIAAGRIAHPYRDDNETLIRWMEERDWWYRGEFAGPVDLGPDERLRLTFLGLDTIVEVWLNGELLGAHENMFRPAVFDITERVQARNDLLLRFSPPLAGLEVPPNVIDMFSRRGQFPDNRLYFAEIKDIPFGTSTLDSEVALMAPGVAEVTVTAHGHAYFVHIPSPMPGLRFSDHYLDLRDGHSAAIRVTGLPEGFDPKQLEVRGYAGAPVAP
ncbi:glycosyl hydrolase 2 galactose-binding domain-containing protein [Streptomyces sp. NPDC002514]|uniref:glycosyl hydrolase 2 galactose-binding domain-containing protein n=1 Tax=Streptomyces sp. NPDC001270 TaxID=3364554 RepID=UPI003676F57A